MKLGHLSSELVSWNREGWASSKGEGSGDGFSCGVEDGLPTTVVESTVAMVVEKPSVPPRSRRRGSAS